MRLPFASEVRALAARNTALVAPQKVVLKRISSTADMAICKPTYQQSVHMHMWWQW